MSNPAHKHRIVLVDDHPVVLRGLAELLGEEPDLAVVAQAASAAEALTAIETEHPDLVITDLVLPGTGGVTLIQDIKARWATLPVLVLSQHDELIYAERALHAGALGYVIKEDAPTQVVSAVRHVLDGRLYLSEEINERLLYRFTHNAAPSTDDSIELLSNRELEVFEAMGRGHETDEIAALLHMGPATVATHRKRIKEKLGVEKLTQLIREAVLWVEGQATETLPDPDAR